MNEEKSALEASLQLEEKVAAINSSIVSDRSKDIYMSKLIGFIQWLDADDTRRSRLLSNEFLEMAERDDDGRLKRGSLKTIILSARRPCPVRCDAVTAHDIQLWLASLKKRSDGSDVGNSTYNTARSAVTFLYRSYEYNMSREVEFAIQTFFKGLKRLTADAKERGEGKVSIGEEKLEFSLYRFLAHSLMTSGDGEDIFCQTYLVLCWNLMCRARSTANIALKHISFTDDNISIYFAKSKMDQEGEHTKHPRHVYANPLEPSICVFLSLGIFFLCFRFQNPPQKLFTGSEQYKR